MTSFVVRLLGVSGFFLLGCFVYAQEVLHDECLLADVFLDDSGSVKKQVLDPFQSLQVEDMYPVDAAKVAIQHLQASCCQAKELASQKCQNIPPTFANQKMLFRHIVDIGMRRMDGYAEGIYGHKDLLDPIAVAWREYLDVQGRSLNGTPPQILVNKFHQMVGGAASDESFIVAPVIGPDSSFQSCRSLQQYDVLGKRIDQQCAIAYCVTEELYERAEIMGYAASKQGLQLMYHECLPIQQDRLLEEYRVTNAIIQEQATIMSQRSLESYLQDYMVNTRLRTLADEVIKRVAGIDIVNGKYTQGTAMCN